MTDDTVALRYSAFASEPGGGNPAGIVLDASSMSDAEMQAIAAEVGFAETAFVAAVSATAASVTAASATGFDGRRLRLRYFSPIAEVPFCGHATIATAVVLAERHGTGEFVFETAVGDVVIATSTSTDTDTVDAGAASITASFTSVEPRIDDIPDGVLDELLGLLGATRASLDPAYPPRLSFAGNWHPVVVFAGRAEFDGFTFDPRAMRALMNQQGWAGTVTTLFSVAPLCFDARNLFPVGAITEDPATGSAAASVGGYLRALGLIEPPARVTVTQGSHVGRPSILRVDVPEAGGIVVTGGAVAITE